MRVSTRRDASGCSPNSSSPCPPAPFNPGAAVYIFPNVCATLSFGLGGIQYTSVTQKDAEGHKIGSRKASNMKFKLNIAAINVGMTIHLWDKKKK